MIYSENLLFYLYPLVSQPTPLATTVFSFFYILPERFYEFTNQNFIFLSFIHKQQHRIKNCSLFCFFYLADLGDPSLSLHCLVLHCLFGCNVFQCMEVLVFIQLVFRLWPFMLFSAFTITNGAPICADTSLNISLTLKNTLTARCSQSRVLDCSIQSLLQ